MRVSGLLWSCWPGWACEWGDLGVLKVEGVVGAAVCSLLPIALLLSSPSSRAAVPRCVLLPSSSARPGPSCPVSLRVGVEAVELFRVLARADVRWFGASGVILRNRRKRRNRATHHW